jgi:hypothetical protein
MTRTTRQPPDNKAEHSTEITGDSSFTNVATSYVSTHDRPTYIHLRANVVHGQQKESMNYRLVINSESYAFHLYIMALFA